MANVIAYFDIPQNSFVTHQLTKPAKGVLLQNNTNVFVEVLNDRGAVIMDCPPGITLGWNEPDSMFSPQVGCVGNYQGNGRVFFYDGLLDLSGNPSTLQPPGTIPVNIQSGTVDIGTGTVNLAPGTAIQVTSGTVTIGGTAAVSDAITQGKLLTLIDSIGTQRVLLTANNGIASTAAMVAPIEGFILSVTAVRRQGLLTVQSAGPGVNNNTVLSTKYIGPEVPKLPFDFDEIVPIGFQIVVNFTGDGDFSVSF